MSLKTLTSLRVRGPVRFDQDVICVGVPWRPKREYMALVSQTGVGVPTAVVLSNTTGLEIVWQRLDVAISEGAGAEPGLYGFAYPGLTAARLFAVPYNDVFLQLGFSIQFDELSFGPDGGVLVRALEQGTPDDNVLVGFPFHIIVI